MMKKFLTFLFFLAGGTLSFLNAAFQVAEGGKSVSEIIVPEDPSEELLFAARELQMWIGRISGGEGPGIYHAPTRENNSKIFLGKEFYAPEEDFRFIGDSDGWVVREEGRNLYLSGLKDTGVINGVFRLLDLNTDLVFPRPDLKEEALFTPDPDLTFRKTDFRGRPSWKFREFSLVNVHFDPQTSLWARRNYSNSRGMFYNKYHIRSTLDLFFTGSLTYELGSFLPNAKYFAEHPTYYAWQEGKRKPYEHYGPQLCYTNPEGREALIREMLARLEQDLTPQIRKVHFGFGDTWSLCSCTECRKAIPLPDGTSLPPDDDAFRSTQYFLYLNAIVEAMVKKYPQLEAETLGYLYAAVPPRVKPHPKLTVIYCPYPKNDKLPVDGKGNEKWGARSRKWAESGARIGIYEYWGDASDFPRPVADAAAENLKLWNSLGFHHHLMTETYPDVRQTPAEKDSLAGAWDVSAMEYWVLSRLMLDSSQEPDALRREYLERVYGPAAAAVLQEYYGAIRKAWHADKSISMYNDNAVWCTELYIRRTGLEQQLREKLAAAEKLAAGETARELVRKQRRRFDFLVDSARKIRPDLFEIPLLPDAEKQGIPDFDSPLWNSAARIEELKIPGKKSGNREERRSIAEDTRVLLLHNRRNLYVKFICREPDMKRLDSQKDPSPGRFPSGDCVELFLKPEDSKTYYHFAATLSGARYDAEGYNHRWNLPSWDFLSRRNSESWEGILRIPLDELGFRITVNNKCRILPARIRAGASAPGEKMKKGNASFAGARRHMPDTFPAMLLKE